MQLIYRGIKYEYAPVAVEATETEVVGKYRGADWKRHSGNVAVAQHGAELKYRGAVYYSGNPEEVKKLKKRKKLNFIFGNRNNFFATNKTTNNKLAKTHSANLCRDLQRRFQLAKQMGDEALLLMLEDEANQLSFENCQLSFEDC